MRKLNRKIDMYVLSLGLLFVFFLIIATKFPTQSFDFKSVNSWIALAKSNPLPITSIIGLIYCIMAFVRFKFDLNGATDIPFEISKIENINYEHLTFLATYVVPLISFDFSSNRQLLVLALLLIVMGVIYIKTDLFYANPSLALLGFRIYKVDGDFKTGKREGIVLICRGRLSEGEKVSYIKLDDRIYYVKRSGK